MAIVNIRDRHREIMRRLLMGQRQCDIAQDLQMSESQLSIIIHSPMFRQAMNTLQDRMDQDTFDVVEAMREHSEEAAQTIVSVMKDPFSTNTEKLSSAKTVLALAGHGPQAIKTGDVINNFNNLTFEQKLEIVEETQKYRQLSEAIN